MFFVEINNGYNVLNMTGSVTTEEKYDPVYVGMDDVNDRVLRAIQKIDRKEFVPEAYQKEDYDNGPIPLGYGQTMSSSFIVELMTNLVNTAPHKVVLEIGTGSGYQAAILSLLVNKVYSMETVPVLAKDSKNNLKKMGISNVYVKCGNGYFGWEEKSPFDAIIVSAAVPHIPQRLIQQLKPGGHMVLPVGNPNSQQMLSLVTKNKKGILNTESILPVTFAPLVSGTGEGTYYNYHAEY